MSILKTYFIETIQKNQPVLPVGEREGVREGGVAATRAAVRPQGHHRAAARLRRRAGARRARPAPARRRLSRGDVHSIHSIFNYIYINCLVSLVSMYDRKFEDFGFDSRVGC